MRHTHGNKRAVGQSGAQRTLLLRLRRNYAREWYPSTSSLRDYAQDERSVTTRVYVQIQCRHSTTLSMYQCHVVRLS
jgi:hypothetical protein